MVIIGQLLITVGFLVGATSAVLRPDGVNWAVFTIGVVIGVIGVIVVQIGLRKAATHADTVTSNIQAIGSSLASLVGCAEKLETEKEDLNVYDVHVRIDELFPTHLDTFVQARQSMIHAFSMQHYADVMNHFAAGERTINRVWSASVDGYIDEVQECISMALEHFQNAKNHFEQFKVQDAA